MGIDARGCKGKTGREAYCVALGKKTTRLRLTPPYGRIIDPA